MIDAYVGVIDAMLYADPFIKALVIHERLVAEPYNFGGNYQRTKIYVRHRRPEILRELALEGLPEMHRRFEVLPGAQAQIDWGDEGELATPGGVLPVYSFHMTLSYSRDPFTRYRLTCAKMTTTAYVDGCRRSLRDERVSPRPNRRA
jgi:hypothetical protein